MPTVRMFIAAELPPGAANALSEAARRLRQEVAARYSRPENYHVTLAFLGETDLSLVGEISAIVQRAAQGTPPIGARLDGLGFFGKPSGAVLWGGLAGADALAGLAERIRAGCGQSGIRYDPKPMRAHITLARQARLAGVDLGKYGPHGIPAPISKITLFESVRQGGKLVYLPLFTQPLE